MNMNTGKIRKFCKKFSVGVMMSVVAFALLYVGDKLQVVTYTELAVDYLQATTVEKTVVTRNATKKRASHKVVTKSPRYANVEMYLAKPGDSLSNLARSRKIKLGVLLSANKGMTINTKLKIDQMVFIPLKT